MLKPIDLVVLLKIECIPDDQEWGFATLAHELGISSSSVHESVVRSRKCHLLAGKKRRPIQPSLLEFMEHGMKYSFPSSRGGASRGWPTTTGAMPLKAHFAEGSDVLVWPDARGPVLGTAFEPLHPCVTKAIQNDSCLYEWLTLADAIRDQSAREASLAVREIRRRLGGHIEE